MGFEDLKSEFEKLSSNVEFVPKDENESESEDSYIFTFPKDIRIISRTINGKEHFSKAILSESFVIFVGNYPYLRFVKSEEFDKIRIV